MNTNSLLIGLYDGQRQRTAIFSSECACQSLRQSSQSLVNLGEVDYLVFEVNRSVDGSRRPGGLDRVPVFASRQPFQDQPNILELALKVPPRDSSDVSQRSHTEGSQPLLLLGIEEADTRNEYRGQEISFL